MNVRRIAKRGVLGLLGTVAVLGVVWVGAHVVLAEARPAPFATASELGPIPPTEGNGFPDLARSKTRARSAPKSVPALSKKAAEFPSWAQAETAHAPLAAYLAEPDSQALLAEADGALGKPLFADACADRFDNGCAVFPVLSALRLESYRVLSLAQDGQNDEATRRLGRLLRAQRTWLTAPRTFISQVAAVSLARSTINLTKLVAPHLSPEQRATLLPGVAAFATTPADLSRLVKVNYLEDMAALDFVVNTSSGWHLSSVTAPPAPPTLYERFVSQRLLDRGRTERVLTDRAKQTLRWVEKGDVSLPASTRYGDSAFLWAYNPVGELLLDGGISPTLWETTRDDARALQREAADYSGR